ncbi:MAG: cytochrome c peroxidase [Cytophagales bacterium]
MNKYLNHIGIFILALIIFSCRENNEPLPQEEIFVVEVPSNFEDLPVPESNEFSKEKIELGRLLFYDPILSGNNQVSCASCHIQSKAFTDGDALTRRGVSGEALLRHTPALINLAWMPGLFWEGGAKNIESLALGPIGHPDEMNQDIVELVKELNEDSEYPLFFQNAFGPGDIELTQVLKALAQFQRTLISGDSRYDKYIRNEDGVTFSMQELNGLSLYEEHCSSCHSGFLFTDNAFHNNGIDSSWNDISNEFIFTGRYRITFDSADLGKYKTPTLRNIALTAPYMHDGRFESLEEVLDHYSAQVKYSPSLDEHFKNEDGTYGIPLSEEEKTDIIRFLNSLTDEEFISNQRFSSPK